MNDSVQMEGERRLAALMFTDMVGYTALTQRNEPLAMQLLEELKERAKSQYVPSYWIAVIHNGFRDRAQVVTWMQKAFEERSSWLAWSNVEPRFAWLRNDPDFASLLSKMKLV
ncbi:MAG TPA: hypothetical protein VJ785_08355 [Anaerolineales bacterium]|nr:hypothetical protein [Anaerolineales bacterium]